MALTVTSLGSVFNTTAGSKAVTATPTAGDLIILVTAHTGFTAATAPTDNNSDGLGSYTLLQSGTKNASADTISIWARNSAIGSASSTVFTHNAASSSGGGVVVLRVAGATRFGSGVKKKSGAQSNATVTGTPSVSLGSAALTTNAIVAACFSATNSTTTVANNASYTEVFDNGYNTPATGLEVMTRNSGETGSSIAWGGSATQPFGAVAVELDASSVAAVSTLTDNFDDNSRDTAKWNAEVWGEATTYTNGTISETAGKVQVTPTGVGANGAGYTSVSTYDVRDARAFLRMDPGTLADGQNCVFYVGNSNDQYYSFIVIPSSNTFVVRLRNGFNANVYSGTIPVSGPIWLSIRYQTSDSTWYFDYADPSTASDPPSSWTNIASRGSDFSAASCMVGFGYYAAGGTPQTQYFDGFNTATTTATGYTLTAASGAFSLTGTAASLKSARLLTAASANYAFTGTAATLKKGYSLTAAPGAFSLTGTAANLPTTRKLTAAATSFALTGTAAALKRGLKVTAASGSLALSGPAAGLYKGFKLTAASGAFSLSGTATALRAARSLSAGAASFTLTGTAVTLRVAMPAAAGSFTLTGTAAGLKAGRLLAAGAGSYTFTGTSASFRKGSTLTASPGAFSLTGTAASIATARKLTAAAGAYTLTGTAASLTKLSASTLAAGSGSFVLTGTAANLTAGRKISASSGSFALTGTAAAFRIAHRLTASAGSYTLTGTAATLTKGGTALQNYTMTASAGSFAYTGSTASLRANRVLIGGAAAYNLTGASAGLYRGHYLSAGSGSFVSAGGDAAFLVGRVIQCAPGDYTLSGAAAVFNWSGFVPRKTVHHSVSPELVREAALASATRSNIQTARRPTASSGSRPANLSRGTR